MKNPSFAKFMNKVESTIANLDENQLRNVLMSFAENTDANERYVFLEQLKASLASLEHGGVLNEELMMSPEELLEEITAFNQRILDGEFFDEELNQRAWENEEPSYWREYDDYEDIDFSSEEYVLVADDLLDRAKLFYRQKDLDTAYKAYKLLFDIFENPDYYDDEKYFVYNFSFKEALSSDVFVEHETIYLRCLYFNFEKENDFQSIYSEILKRKILLSEIVEIDREPLPRQEEFIDGFVNFLQADARNDKYLVDALFLKGGIEPIRKFAYSKGEKHPPVFLAFYQYQKSQNIMQTEQKQIILDGLKIIPEKFKTKSILCNDLIEMARELNDNDLLLLGLSTAFYSMPSLRNLAYFLNFIHSENNKSEINKLSKFLSEQNVKKNSYNFSFEILDSGDAIYSLDSYAIDRKSILLGRFILQGIQPLLHFINPKDYLGFSNGKNHVAIACALALKSISRDQDAFAIDNLLDHYCFDLNSPEYVTLKNLVSKKAISLSDPHTLAKSLQEIEKLAINRVAYILDNKKRGGYDSACLLLVACAEGKQILTGDGNNLILQIDMEYKRFSAFRKPLKSLTFKSKLLVSVT
ncbi:MAG: hypothetical protein GXO75_01840 [Calditrichaeota bacterium]|nr:hypothetical protein [Calditrichota bacterium]